MSPLDYPKAKILTQTIDLITGGRTTAAGAATTVTTMTTLTRFLVCMAPVIGNRTDCTLSLGILG